MEIHLKINKFIKSASAIYPFGIGWALQKNQKNDSIARKESYQAVSGSGRFATLATNYSSSEFLNV